MANRVTISALGSTAISLDDAKGHASNIQEMIRHWDRQIEQVLPDQPDLIVLPEACDRPANFTGDRRTAYYEARGEQIRDHFMDVARKHGTNIAYSAARRLPDGTYRNSTQFINRQGKIDGIYNKNHLVVTEHSNYGILYGREAPVIQTDFGTVGGVICFDLNFEELRRKYEQSRPQLLVFSSMYHGGLMQNYWAYSCRAYFVGAINIGNLPNSIINPLGHTVAEATNYFSSLTATVNLDYAVAHLDFNRERLCALKEKYGRGVAVFDPGRVGAVLITSETDGVSAMDMVREFDIELWDDYYARSLADRHVPGHIEP